MTVRDRPQPARGLDRRSRVAADPRLLALLGACTIAFSGILVRLAAVSPTTAAVFRCVYALPVLVVLARREDRRLGVRRAAERRPALIAGLFLAGDLVLWNASIADVGAGLATVLANIQVVLVPLVAWALLRERPRRPQLLALPVCALGVLLISGALEHGAYGRDPRRGTLLAVGAGVAYVGFLLLLRHGGDRRETTAGTARRVAGPLCDATLTAGIGSLIVGVATRDVHLVPSWPSAGWLVVLGLGSQVVGWMLITSSLPRLPAAIGSMLLTVQPVGSVALAAIIFGESPSIVQLAGVALVLAGLLSVRGAPGRPTRPDASVPESAAVRHNGGSNRSESPERQPTSS